MIRHPVRAAGFLALLSFAVACGAPSNDAGATSASVNMSFSASAFTLASQDGTSLQANVFVPDGPVGATYPAVILINSWTMGDYEYLVQAADFARRGYIALSYATRGFGFSGGEINVAGPADLQDLSAVIDWLQANTPVDAANIGAAGISYGGGIAVMGAALEPRIKTAVSMSGFVDVRQALYGGDTPRLVWGLVLVGSGYFTGKMDPAIAQLYEGILTNDTSQMETLESWASERSAVSYVDRINAANKPIYLSNNLSDDLFQPNPILNFYTQLTGPKRLDLNQGEHAEAEGPGLVKTDNYVWNNVHDWFDEWLKSLNTGIMAKPPVSIAMKFADGRAELDGWPASTVQNRRFFLRARGLIGSGGLDDAAPSDADSTKIVGGVDTIATSGFPILSNALQPIIGVRTYSTPSLVNPVNGINYLTPPLDQGLQIRGPSALHIPVSSSSGQAEVVAYLYDVNPLGLGTLLTHGVASLHDAAGDEVRDLDISISALAHDVAPGHRLALSLDTFDLLYAPPTLEPYFLTVHPSSDDFATLDVAVTP